mgnify:CR=1 FL=1
MAWHWIVQNWLRSVAEAKIREAVAEAARQQMASAAAAPASGGQVACDVGVVFALGEESGGLEDLLEQVATLQGNGFAIRVGLWQGRRVAVAISGTGCACAARAAEALILGHSPRLVFSAGFCGGLSDSVKRRDLVVAERIVGPHGEELGVDLEPIRSAPLFSRPGVHVGRIVTVESIVRRPGEKRALGREFDALAVDLESFAVAEVCARRQVRFLAVRVVSDAVDDRLPREVERLSRQKSRAARLGAALGAILDRPGAAKELYRLKQDALAASDRLARGLASLIGFLVPAPPEEGTNQA